MNDNTPHYTELPIAQLEENKGQIAGLPANPRNIQPDTEEETKEYKQFVEKFKPKKTTDDCYTPPEVYEAVKQWVLEEVPEIRELRIVRPFYPGGDYQAEDYTGAVVIDKPPFSILAEIKRFYLERNIPFFLFAPALTVLSPENTRITSIIANCTITYHNGAVVSTSFVSNLFGDTAFILSPDIVNRVKEAQPQAKVTKTLPLYEYPPNVVTSSSLNRYLNRGVSFRVPRSEVHFTKALDNQRKVGKGLYGSGFIISDRVVKILQSAPKLSREIPIRWDLSEREREIIRKLNGETQSQGD